MDSSPCLFPLQLGSKGFILYASTEEREHVSPWVPITPNDGERMEHMQIVLLFLCHAKRRV